MIEMIIRYIDIYANQSLQYLRYRKMTNRLYKVLETVEI